MSSNYQIAYQFLANDTSFTKTVNNLNKTLKDFKKNFKDTLNQPITLSEVAHTAMATIPFAGIAKSVQKAGEFETAIADILKTGHLAREDVDKTRKAIIDLSVEIGKPATYLAQAYQSAIQSGIHHADVMKQLKIVEKAAVAFDLPVQETTRQLNFIRQNFKLTMGQVGEFGDVVSDLHHQLGGALVGDLLSVTSGLSGVAMQSGLSKESVASMSAVMLNAGAEASRVQNALKTLFVNAKNFEKLLGGKRMRLLQESGLDLNAVKNLMAKDFPSGLRMLLEGIKNLKDRSGAIIGLVGRDYQDVIANLVNNTEKLDTVMQRVFTGKHLGSMNVAFQAKMATYQKNIDRFRESINALAIEFGTHLLPFLTKVINKLTEMIKPVVDFVREHKNLVKAIASIITIMVGLKVSTLALRFLWQAFFLKEIFQVGSAILSVASKFGILKTTMNFGMLLPGLGTLITTVYLLDKALEKLGITWHSVFDDIISMWKDIKKEFSRHTIDTTKPYESSYFGTTIPASKPSTTKETETMTTTSTTGETVRMSMNKFIDWAGYKAAGGGFEGRKVIGIGEEIRRLNQLQEQKAQTQEQQKPQVNVEIVQNNVINSDGTMQSRASVRTPNINVIPGTVRLYNNSTARRIN